MPVGSECVNHPPKKWMSHSHKDIGFLMDFFAQKNGIPRKNTISGKEWLSLDRSFWYLDTRTPGAGGSWKFSTSIDMFLVNFLYKRCHVSLFSRFLSSFSLVNHAKSTLLPTFLLSRSDLRFTPRPHLACWGIRGSCRQRCRIAQYQCDCASTPGKFNKTGFKAV